MWRTAADLRPSDGSRVMGVEAAAKRQPKPGSAEGEKSRIGRALGLFQWWNLRLHTISTMQNPKIFLTAKSPLEKRLPLGRGLGRRSRQYRVGSNRFKIDEVQISNIVIKRGGGKYFSG